MSDLLTILYEGSPWCWLCESEHEPCELTATGRDAFEPVVVVSIEPPPMAFHSDHYHDRHAA